MYTMSNDKEFFFSDPCPTRTHRAAPNTLARRQYIYLGTRCHKATPAHSINRRGYSDDAINLCLREFARPSSYMAAPAGRIRLGMQKTTILSKLPEGCDRFILVIEKAFGNQLSNTGYLHAYV